MDRNRKYRAAALAAFMALALSACALPWSKSPDEDDKDRDVISEEQKEMPTIVINSGQSFAEDVTEEVREAAKETEEKAAPEETQAEEPPAATIIDKMACEPGQEVYLDPSWEYASFSKIHDGAAVYYAATGENRNGIVVGVNAGHGTKGGESVKTYCHPDMSPKTTGGTTGAGAIEAYAVSSGMSFDDGTPEAKVTLKLAQFMRDDLLAAGYDVLMLRDSDDVQLDNVARTVICNNVADCHIAIHFDGDGLDTDKGCFFSSGPDGLKGLPPVDRTWHMSDEFGARIVNALSAGGHKLHSGGKMAIDLTQTSYSTIPSVDVEYGNQSSDISDAALQSLAADTVVGIEDFFDVSN